MIDSHCHLEMQDFEDDFESVIDRMKIAGVKGAISIGSIAQNERIERTFEIVGLHDFIKTTLGVHPKSIFQGSEADLIKLFAKYYEPNKDSVVAVGEIGLDYFLQNLSEEEFKKAVKDQERLFRFQIELAIKHKLPIIVHIRDAYDEAIKILEEYAGSVKGFYGGVIHCFSAKEAAVAEKFVKLGFFISFSGNITYKNNAHIREIAKIVPSEKILIETDSPYLAPQKFRGKRNEPSFVKFVLETIAELKDVDVAKLDGLTTQNTVNLFSLNNISGFYPGVAYKIRNSVYVNLTNKCTNRCSFCPKYQGGEANFTVQGYNLELKQEPSAEEVVSSVFRYYDFSEVVFCGLGEPTLRLKTLIESAKIIKEKSMAQGGENAKPLLKIRLDTDGLANGVYGRNIPKELTGLIDKVSISLNSHNAEFYDSICRPQLKAGGLKANENMQGQDQNLSASSFSEFSAYDFVLEFIKDSVKYIGDVTVSAVDLPGLDVHEAERKATALGAKFRLRAYNNVG